MEFFPFVILQKVLCAPDTFLLRIKPKDGSMITPFSPGQYIQLRVPQLSEDIHSFSIASSPNTSDYLELLIKIYGNWTQHLSKVPVGTDVDVAGPFGTMIWDSTHDRNAVFLVGGIGISPVMSILKFINEQQYEGSYCLLYGNKTPETIAYEEELKQLERSIKTLKIIHIYSDLPNSHPWDGYRGFITKEVVEKEVDFSLQPTYFIIGPQIFIQKMTNILKKLHVNKEKLKSELIG